MGYEVALSIKNERSRDIFIPSLQGSLDVYENLTTNHHPGRAAHSSARTTRSNSNLPPSKRKPFVSVFSVVRNGSRPAAALIRAPNKQHM